MAARVDVYGLKEMARALDILARDSLGTAVQAGVNDVANDALDRLKTVFIMEIEGGPVQFTEIRPGSKNSSVLANTFRKPFPDAARSNVKVQDKQSAYLKFLLNDDANVRRPGDVGVADTANFIAKPDLMRLQGIDVTDEGNLPHNSLKKLFTRAAKRRSPPPPAPGKKRRRVSRGGKADIWFGTRKGGGKTKGFWQRPRDRTGKPILVVKAVETSNYSKSDLLVKGWNRAVTKAGDGMADAIDKHLADAVRKAHNKRVYDAFRKASRP